MTVRATGLRSPADWDEVRRRMAAAAEQSAEALAPSPERRRAVLESRARDLARRIAPEASAGEMIEVLMIVLGDESYALETRHVRQVVRPGACTPVPCGNEFLTGVINLDGEILAVFDLGSALGATARARPPAHGSRVVVLGDDQDEFGVMVDAAREVTILRTGDLLDPAANGDSRRWLLGLTADATGVLDGREILGDERFRVDRTA